MYDVTTGGMFSEEDVPCAHLNAIRETEEEVGLRSFAVSNGMYEEAEGVDLERPRALGLRNTMNFCGKMSYTDQTTKVWAYMYKLVLDRQIIDQELKLQESEV